MICIQNYKQLPNIFEPAEEVYVRTHSEILGNQSLYLTSPNMIPSFNEFAKKYSSIFYDVQDLLNVLKEEKFVSAVPIPIYSKMLSYIIKKYRISVSIKKEKLDLSGLLIQTVKGCKKLETLKKPGDFKLPSLLVSEMTSYTSTSDLKYFLNDLGIMENLFSFPITNENNTASYLTTKQNINIPIKTKTYKNISGITRWRSAEFQCVEIERSLGNEAIDVSKKNVGYDIESIEPNGNKRYIEVKLIKGDSSFSITNNEYTAASQYGANYFICLIQHLEGEGKVIATYIQNPLKNAVFEKRIRQWEWVCEEFTGKELEMPFN